MTRETCWTCKWDVDHMFCDRVTVDDVLVEKMREWTDRYCHDSVRMPEEETDEPCPGWDGKE